MKRAIIIIVSLAFPLAALADIAATSTDQVATSTPSDQAPVSADASTTPSTTDASTTDATATSTTPDSTLDSSSDASTTPSSSDIATSTPNTDTDASSTIQTQPNATSTTQSTVTPDSVASLEETYYQDHGTYLQILPGNTLPSYESGSVTNQLGATIPGDARVDVYEAPNGKGYQITYTDNGTVHSVGYGPEAQARTYSYALPSASSTSPVGQ